MSIHKIQEADALLLYRVGPVFVCSPTMQVESVVQPPKFNVPPGANVSEPGFFKSLHGMVRVVDLRVRFGVDEDDRDPVGRIIITEVEGGHAGFWVDEIEDVASFPEKGWGQVPAHIPRQVFSRTLLSEGNIRLYAEFEALDSFKSHGYLRKHIEHIKKAQAQGTKAESSISAQPATQQKQAASAEQVKPVDATKATGVKQDQKNPPVEQSADSSSTLEKTAGTARSLDDKTAADHSSGAAIDKLSTHKPDHTPSVMGKSQHGETQAAARHHTSPVSREMPSSFASQSVEKNKPGRSVHSSASAFASGQSKPVAGKPAETAPLRSTSHHGGLAATEYSKPIAQATEFSSQTNARHPDVRGAGARNTGAKNTDAKNTDEGSSGLLFLLVPLVILMAAGAYFTYDLMSPNEQLRVVKHTTKPVVKEDPVVTRGPASSDYDGDRLPGESSVVGQVEISRDDEDIVIVVNNYEEIVGEDAQAKLPEEERVQPVKPVSPAESDVIKKPEQEMQGDVADELATTDEAMVPAVPEAAEVQDVINIAKDDINQSPQVQQPEELVEDYVDAQQPVEEESTVPEKQRVLEFVEAVDTVDVPEKAAAELQPVIQDKPLTSTAPEAVKDVMPAKPADTHTVTSRKHIHIVVKGDTLWDIAQHYVNNPWRYPELARLSKIRNPDLIYPGQKIIIILNYKQSEP